MLRLLSVRRWLSTFLVVSAGVLIVGCSSNSTVESDGPLQLLSPSAIPGSAHSLPFAVFPPSVVLPAIAEKRLVTIRDEQAWKQLWSERSVPGFVYRPPIPSIDFSQNMVVGIFLGIRSACDRVEISSVRQLQSPARIEVAYREIPPTVSTCVTSAVYLSTLATIPRRDMPVDFLHR